MQLKEFRVQNYKKIDDSGWITCDRLMVFVGKNEAGKSTVFRGLSKLNPSDGEEYDGLKEFPRRRYADEFHKQDWPVTTGRFLLEQDERQAVTEMAPALAEPELAEVTRCYSGRYLVSFRPAASQKAVPAAELRHYTTRAIHQTGNLFAPEGGGDAMRAFKQTLTHALQQAQADLPSTGIVTAFDVQDVITAVTAQVGETWQRDLADRILAPLRELGGRAEVSDQIEEAAEWVVAHLPRFVYFDRYGVLDTAIHIPTFLFQRDTQPSAPSVRTTQCLFKHVGV